MEHTLRAIRGRYRSGCGGLNPCFSGTYSQRCVSTSRQARLLVLILVLVEHTLRDFVDLIDLRLIMGLNPCFSGTYSQRWKMSLVIKRVLSGLNPCFSGTYSQSGQQAVFCGWFFCLNPCFSGTYSQRKSREEIISELVSLNPCFSGTYSQSPYLRTEGVHHRRS